MKRLVEKYINNWVDDPERVKSGSQGKMQSMWMFLKEKNCKEGIRISLENFASYSGVNVYPLYAIERIF